MDCRAADLGGAPARRRLRAGVKRGRAFLIVIHKHKNVDAPRPSRRRRGDLAADEDRVGKIDGLKVSHHGHKTGDVQPTVAKLAPWLTITSVGPEARDRTDSHCPCSTYAVSLRDMGDICSPYRSCAGAADSRQRAPRRSSQ